MVLPPGVAAARRLIAIVGAVLVIVAVGGALAYASQDTPNGCGSGWSAARTPIPSPLLTPAEIDAIQKAKRNPYEAASEKAKPFEACRRAGSSRLIRAGLGGALVVLPVAGILTFLYWPRREEPTDVIDLGDERDGPAPFTPGRTGGWPGR